MQRNVYRLQCMADAGPIVEADVHTIITCWVEGVPEDSHMQGEACMHYGQEDKAHAEWKEMCSQYVSILLANKSRCVKSCCIETGGNR